MTHYHVRKGTESYGHSIGIVLIDCETPFIPGDVGNASTYGFPVLYRTAPGVSLDRLIEQGDPTMVGAVIETARELEKAGVRAITSDCGYMIRFHRQVAEAVNIPVIFSSLLQIPLIAATLGPDQAVGIICANRKRLTPDLLAVAGVQKGMKVVIRGMENSTAFRGPILDETGTLDDTAIEKEVVARAVEMVTAHPETGAILLECSNLPPYAHAVQRATGRPVFDFITLINYMHNAFHRKPFSGIF